MPTLLLRMHAPMQSWGVQSRFGDRDSGRFPSKSGVIGLLCAALGRDRAKPVDDLAALRMAVRVDRPGVLSRDFHTAGGGTFAGAHYGVAKANRTKSATVISMREYLADADFLVALEGDRALLETCRDALEDPAWPLFLGRKAFPPEYPLLEGIHDETAEELFATVRWRGGSTHTKKPGTVQWVLEGTPGDGLMRPDQPESFAHDARRFGQRHLKTRWEPLPGATPRTAED